MQYSKMLKMSDLDVAARTVYGEARGETAEGKLAVAWVIRNRSEIDLHSDGKPDWWGETITEVCQKSWQFSCWNKNDPNSEKLKKLDWRNIDYQYAYDAVVRAMSGNLKDPTEGATHYHHEAVHPKWAAGKRYHKKIGHHIFYKDIG